MKGTGTAALLALAILTFAGWTTNKSAGTSQSFCQSATTGVIIGTGVDSLPKGITFLSIADVGGTGAATVYIESDDIAAGSDIIPIGSGTAIDINCPHGIDSLNILTNTTTLGFHASN